MSFGDWLHRALFSRKAPLGYRAVVLVADQAAKRPRIRSLAGPLLLTGGLLTIGALMGRFLYNGSTFGMSKGLLFGLTLIAAGLTASVRGAAALRRSDVELTLFFIATPGGLTVLVGGPIVLLVGLWLYPVVVGPILAGVLALALAVRWRHAQFMRTVAAIDKGTNAEPSLLPVDAPMDSSRSSERSRVDTDTGPQV